MSTFVLIYIFYVLYMFVYIDTWKTETNKLLHTKNKTVTLVAVF